MLYRKKLKNNERKRKKNEIWAKIIAEMTNGGVICSHRCPR